MMAHLLRLFGLYKYSWALSCLVIVGSLTPGDQLPEAVLLSYDKLVHFLMYFMLVSVILIELIRQYRFLKFCWILTALVYAICLGCLIEVLQGCCVSGRKFDLLDIIANSAGALAGGCAVSLGNFWREK